MWLACTRRCGGELFRALTAEVDIDASGEYQAHHVLQPGYVCLVCGAPAVDLAQVPAAMAAEQEETTQIGLDVLCPICETPVTMGPEAECPNCGSPLEIP